MSNKRSKDEQEADRYGEDQVADGKGILVPPVFIPPDGEYPPVDETVTQERTYPRWYFAHIGENQCDGRFIVSPAQHDEYPDHTGFNPYTDFGVHTAPPAEAEGETDGKA